MEYELLTGPRQGDCGGGDRIHNHTNARKCTKTLEMFPKCHQHWKIFNNNRDSRSSQLPENLQKQWWIYSQMSVTNAGKSTQNNKSWGEKIFSWNLRRRGHFAESKLEVGSHMWEQFGHGSWLIIHALHLLGQPFSCSRLVLLVE